MKIRCLIFLIIVLVGERESIVLNKRYYEEENRCLRRGGRGGRGGRGRGGKGKGKGKSSKSNNKSKSAAKTAAVVGGAAVVGAGVGAGAMALHSNSNNSTNSTHQNTKKEEDLTFLWIILGIVGFFLLIFILAKIFGKKKRRYGRLKRELVQVDRLYARSLHRNFNKAMRSLRYSKMINRQHNNDLHSSAFKAKVFRTLSTLTKRLGYGEYNYKDFSRRYPRVLHFFSMKARQHELNSFGDVMRVNQEYFNRHYHFDLSKHKLETFSLLSKAFAILPKVMG